MYGEKKVVLNGSIIPTPLPPHPQKPFAHVDLFSYLLWFRPFKLIPLLVYYGLMN